MYTIQSARLPRWCVTREAINLLVIFEGNGVTHSEVPFSASPVDCMAYGRELFERARQGEFGQVGEPSPDDFKQAVSLGQSAGIALATARIAALQQAIDIQADAAALGKPRGMSGGDTLQAQLQAWRLYRVELAQLDAQPGYPAEVEWPTPPEAAAL